MSGHKHSEFFERVIAAIRLKVIDFMDERGLTQLQMSKDTGLSQGAISRLLNSDYPFDLYYLCKVCETYDLPLQRFI